MVWTKPLKLSGNKLEKGLIFTNLVDFDAKFGHRNNPEGYANALVEFDHSHPGITCALRKDDLLILTADHGNDPTTPSTDHSREFVPILLAGSQIKPGMNIGIRETFADMAATIADILEVVTAPSRDQAFKTDPARLLGLRIIHTAEPTPLLYTSGKFAVRLVTRTPEKGFFHDPPRRHLQLTICEVQWVLEVNSGYINRIIPVCHPFNRVSSHIHHPERTGPFRKAAHLQ